LAAGTSPSPPPPLSLSLSPIYSLPLVPADAAEPPASFEDPPSYGLARDIASGEGGWAPGYESEHKVRVHGVAM